MAHKAILHLDQVETEMGPRDVIVWIRDRDTGELMGELRVSRGAVVWRASNERLGRKMGWTKFNRVMQEKGTLAEMRPRRRRRPAR